jgi:hypothetical protein
MVAVAVALLVMLVMVVTAVMALLILLFRVVFPMVLLELVAVAVAVQHTQMLVVLALEVKAEMALVALQIMGAADNVTRGLAKADRVERLELPPKVETMVAGGMAMAEPTVEMAQFVSYIQAQHDTFLQIHKCRIL